MTWYARRGRPEDGEPRNGWYIGPDWSDDELGPFSRRKARRFIRAMTPRWARG